MVPLAFTLAAAGSIHAEHRDRARSGTAMPLYGSLYWVRASSPSRRLARWSACWQRNRAPMAHLTDAGPATAPSWSVR